MVRDGIDPGLLKRASDGDSDALAALQGLLQNARGEDPEAVTALYGLVMGELKRLVRGYFRRYGRGAETQTTLAAHDGFLNLIKRSWSRQETAQFLRRAAVILREDAIDRLRKRETARRKGEAAGRGALAEPIDDRAGGDPEAEARLHELQEVMAQALADVLAEDAELGMLVQMGHFDEMSFQEMSEALGRPKSSLFDDYKDAMSLFLLAMEARGFAS